MDRGLKGVVMQPETHLILCYLIFTFSLLLVLFVMCLWSDTKAVMWISAFYKTETIQQIDMKTFCRRRK